MRRGRERGRKEGRKGRRDLELGSASKPVRCERKEDGGEVNGEGRRVSHVSDSKKDRGGAGMPGEGVGGGGLQRDYRDADRERQRLARERDAQEVARTREGKGVAQVEELNKYVKGEALLASGLGLPEIDSDLEGLEFVRRIDLHNNSLLALGGIRRLGSVTWLRASCNLLRPSLRVVAGMSTVRVMDVGYNALESLEGMSSLRQLRVLIANSNLLTTIVRLENPHLESLILSHNKIHGLGDDVLGEVQSLKKISLSHNLLTELPDLIKCGALMELRLAYNNITTIPSHRLPLTIEILGRNSEK